MNTLVLGNGFDLAHKLPTTYINFLDYIGEIHNFYQLAQHRTDFKNKKEHYIQAYEAYREIRKGRNINTNLLDFLPVNIRENDDISSIFLKQIEDSNDFVKNNIWYKYFRDLKKSLNDGWIDFEKEISVVVNKLENTQDGGRIDIFNLSLNKDELKSRKEVITRAGRDLDKIINFLEQYMLLVNKVKINVISPDIKNIKFDNIINFNYTDTYRRLYRNLSSAKIHFIHGEAGNVRNQKATSNLVLGAVDSLKGEEQSHKLDCIKLKKYYQRIYKKTGLDYKRFFLPKSMQNNNTDKQCLYFFGHSLAVADGDVIRDLIENYNKVIIFYHEDEQYQEQIQNLIDILGKNSVIDYAGSKIEFREQEDMQNI